MADRLAELRALLRRNRVEREVAEELEIHFESLVRGNLARGMSEEEAHRAAMARFGDMDEVLRETAHVDRQLHRRSDWSETAHAVRRGFVLAVRRLAHRPDFTVFALLTLTLAIAAFAALFTVLDRLVLRPLPYDEADDLVWVDSPVPYVGEDAAWGLSVAGYFDFRDNSGAFASLGAFSGGSANFASDAGPARVRLAAISASIVPTLRLRAAHGRLIGPGDDVPGGTGVIVLGHSFWQVQYGGDPAVVGSTIELNGSPNEVIGVMEPGLGLPDQSIDVWRPLGLDPADRPVNAHWLSVVGRLAGGVTPAEAEADLGRLTGTFTDKFPSAYSVTFMRESGFRTGVRPLKERILGGVGRTIWILFAAAGLLLLIAVANITNLYVVRTEGRSRDFAVRAALGAGRRHLVWQCLSETLVLCGAAGVLAVGVAHLGVRLLLASAPASLPRLSELAIGGGTVLFIAAVSFALGLFLGFVPLVYQVFGRDRDLVRSGARTTAAPGRNRARRLMLGGQMALALLLLAAGGLMLRSLVRLYRTDPGFEAEGVLMAEAFIPYGTYGTYDEVAAFYRELVDRLEALPGVASAGATTRLPMIDAGGCAALFIEDRPLGPNEQPPCLPTAMVTEGAFETLGIPVEGRGPTWSAVDAGSGEAVITRALADRLWPGESALGKGIRGNGYGHPFYRVGGIAEDFRSDGLDRPPLEGIFFPMKPIEGAPLWSPPNAMRVVVRTTTAPASLVPALRSVVREMDPTVPLANIQTLADAVGASPSVSRASFSLLLLGIAAGMALLLSAIGVYGVVAQLVAERSGEIAVRIAVGARSQQVTAMVLGQSLRVALAGVIVGLAATLASTGMLRSVLFEVAPTDPLTLGGATALLLATVAAATYLAARRVGRIDPIRTLRAE